MIHVSFIWQKTWSLGAESSISFSEQVTDRLLAEEVDALAETAFFAIEALPGRLTSAPAQEAPFCLVLDRCSGEDTSLFGQ